MNNYSHTVVNIRVISPGWACVMLRYTTDHQFLLNLWSPWIIKGRRHRRTQQILDMAFSKLHSMSSAWVNTSL